MRASSKLKGTDRKIGIPAAWWSSRSIS